MVKKISVALALLTTMVVPGAHGDNTVTIDVAGIPIADITDWGDEFCVQDTSCGANSSQSDGKGACIASNFPTSTEVYLRYDFDEVGLSGNNTMDGCWLVDANENDMVDNALCFSIGSSMGLADSITTTLFTCNDSSTTSCGGPTEVTPSNSACAFNNATPDADQLLDCDVGDTDLAVECSAPLTEMGWMSGDRVQLIQGCSSSSAQPNSSTFECIGSPDDPLIIDPDTGGNTPVELQFFAVE